MAAGRLHFLLAGTPRDLLQSAYRPHPSYLEYLDRLGLSHCTVGNKPADPGSYTWVPFGWDREAVRLGKKYILDGSLEVPPVSDVAGQQVPAYAAVRAANDRKFLQELSGEEEPEESLFVANPDVLGNPSSAGAGIKEWLEQQPDRVLRIKSRHGHAGMGHYRLQPGESLPENWVKYWRARCGVVVERQRQTELNIGSVWQLGVDGQMLDLRHHELLLSSDGSYRGAFLSSGWHPPQYGLLLRRIKVLNNRLHEEGYFGPVELDSFYYRENHERVLRVYVDCNARLTMLYPAYHYKKSLPPGADLLWKVYPAAKGGEASQPDFWKRLQETFLKAFPHREAVIATPPLAKRGESVGEDPPLAGSDPNHWQTLPFVLAVHGKGKDVVTSVESAAKTLLEKHGL